MSETRWTSEQLEAITARDCNLLVAAAAGAGKTAVLVERIIKKITDSENPVDIDRLLIVTFTNAAAAEMRERIAAAISDALDKDPGSRLIQRQMALLGKASITTIHSFCMDVIRSNFQAIDVDPDFRIADETESTLMKLEALEELFEEQYEKQDNKEFFELLESYGGNRDDQAIMDMVLNLYTFIQSSPWPEKWLSEKTESLRVSEGTDFADTIWGKVLLDSVKIELNGMIHMLVQAIDIIGSIGLLKYLPVFREDLSSIESLERIIEKSTDQQSRTLWDSVYECLNSISFSTLPRLSKNDRIDEHKESIERIKKIRDNVKARIKKLKEKIVTSCSKDCVSDLDLIYPGIKVLASLVTGLSLKYAEKKRKKAVADFNDLEHFCLQILSRTDEEGNIKPSDIALSYRERFLEIMVDEYQDSNLVQEIIINMISRVETNKPNVFMVGDVKQSIYRFRQARPELFMDKYNRYSTEKEKPFRKILLYKNFRSRSNVVNAVNFIFRQIMSVNAGELDYTEEEALNPGASFPDLENEKAICGGTAELHLIQTGVETDTAADTLDEGSEIESNSDEPADEILDNIQCEARMVARRIHSLLGKDKDGRSFYVYDKSQKEYRKAEYRDIVILLRTTKKWADVFTEELTLSGIPVFADTGSGFFKTIEVQVMLSLLQIIDNPYQDIPLLSVLRSPVVSFSTDDLTDLRLLEPKGPLFDGLIKLAEKKEGEASNKAGAFLDKLNKWRELSLYIPTDQLIWRLYNDTGYYGFVGATTGGEQRQANLRILFERAKQFEQTSYKGLFNFISFIDRIKSSRGDMGSAKTLSENDNVVRIMSVHKSKGLEFPVVFLSGCGKRFNLQDMNDSILFHQDLGFGPDAVDYKTRLSWPTAAKEAIREKIKAETLSEEMRILYVALTRAREKLIITGSVSDAAKMVQKWVSASSRNDGKIPAYEILNGSTYLDWICPAIIRHKDCDRLYKAASPDNQYKVQVLEDPSQWHIELWNKSDVIGIKEPEQLKDNEIFQWLDDYNSPEDNAIINEIERRLRWEYPYIEASTIPAKISVTELKRRFNAQSGQGDPSLPAYDTSLVKKPGFLEEKKGLSNAEKGTIMHFIMQHLDLRALHALKEKSIMDAVIDQVNRMEEKDLLTRNQIESIDLSLVCSFFNSGLGKRMLKSLNVVREIPFNIEISCKELNIKCSDSIKEESVLLQGVIDCCFEEEDGVVLIDYKTDHIGSDRENIVRKRYKLQMDYYAKALEKLTGKKVKEKCIFLLKTGETIKV